MHLLYSGSSSSLLYTVSRSNNLQLRSRSGLAHIIGMLQRLHTIGFIFNIILMIITIIIVVGSEYGQFVPADQPSGHFFGVGILVNHMFPSLHLFAVDSRHAEDVL